jgi:hypothetical protein
LAVAVGDCAEAAVVEAVVAGAAVVEAGVPAVLNRDVAGAAVVVEPNFSVGAAAGAVEAGCEAGVLAAGCPKRLVVVVVVGVAAGVAVGVPKSVFCADGCGAFEESALNGWAGLAGAGVPKVNVGLDTGASAVLSCENRPPPVEPPATAPKSDFCWVPLVVGGVSDGVVEAMFANRDFCAAGVAVPNRVVPAGLSCGFWFSVPDGGPNRGDLLAPLTAPKSPEVGAFAAGPNMPFGTTGAAVAVAAGACDADDWAPKMPEVGAFAAGPNMPFGTTGAAVAVADGACDADDWAPNGLGLPELDWVNWNAILETDGDW